MKNYKVQEIEHSKNIAANAETIWGWGTLAGLARAERRGNYFTLIAAIRPGKKVLEVGCGTGIYTEKLARTGADIVAIDISSDLLAQARNKIKSPNISFLEADLENLPFPNENFDAVVGVSILHHVNACEALKEIRRVLKPDGAIVFSEPNMLNPQIAFERNIPAIRKMLGNSPSETAFFRWGLARMLKNAGFSEIDIKPFDFLHPLTPKAFIKTVERLGLIIEHIPLLKEFAGSLLISARKA